MSKRGLGKGLDALLGGAKGKGGGAGATGGEPPRTPSEKLPLAKLTAGKYQPRHHFGSEELNALAESVRQHGVIQPLVVRPLSGGRYEIIAGERRFRAAKLAGLTAVPVVVRELSDRDAQLFALIENLQREDLNPIEQAMGLAKLIAEAELTHAAAAEHVGLSRPAVSNLLRLLELAAAVQKLLATGKLDMGHARALLGLPKNRQEAAAKEVISRQLNTRQTEQLVRQLMGGGGSGGSGGGGGEVAKDADTERLEKELTKRLAMRVDIAHRKNGSGKLTLHYGSLDSLDVVLGKLKK